jgi:exosortase/archaeosortase family protein
VNITLDDPRLTAYALDELDGAGRSVIESEMQKFGECRREVEQIARAVALVHAELASEPAPALLPVQQQAIEAKLRLARSKPKLSWVPSTESGRLNWLLKTALATAVVLLISVVKIPMAVTQPAQNFLQNASTDMAYTIMQMAGIPVIKQGLALNVVADAAHQNQIVSFDAAAVCTPPTSSMILLVASLLLGNLYLRSPWKRLLLTLFVIPLVILREGFRMFTIAEFCVHLGGEAAIDFPFLRYGSLLFFALSLIPFVFFLVWLRKLESKP